MAYNPKQLKAVGATGGFAPRFFTYKSEDTVAVIGAENYFLEAFGAFKAEDIVLVLGATSVFRVMICATYTKDAAGDHTIDFSESATFAGDVRATDAAGFLRTNLAKVQDGAKPGELFPVYTYRNNSDTLATMAAANYFLDAKDFLNVGDFIYTVANNGFTIYSVDTVTPTSVVVSAKTIAPPA